MKFANKKKISIKIKNIIRIQIKNRKQFITNILYVLNIKKNLLFIKTLIKKNYKIRFINIKIKIINKIIKLIIAKKRIRNDLYQLTKIIINKIFYFKKSKKLNKII